MQFKLALMKSEYQAIILHFDINSPTKNTIIDLNEIQDHHIQGLLYLDSVINDDLINQLKNEINFYPVASSTPFNINNEDLFNQLKFHEAKNILINIQEKWLLNNNLELLDQLMITCARLTSLWPNNRSDFFVELWYIIKRNLGSSSLKIIYNDIHIKDIKDTKSTKGQLAQTRIDGERLPQPFEGGELEKSLMDHYKHHFAKTFEVTEYDKGTGKLVITSTINESPAIVMAELYQFSPLQKTLLKALFDGLNN